MHRKSKQRAPKSLPIIVGMWGRAQTWREDGFTLLVTLWPTQREWEFQSGTRITTQCLSGQEALIDRPFPLPMSKWLWSYYRKLEAEAAHSQSSPVNASLVDPGFHPFPFPSTSPISEPASDFPQMMVWQSPEERSSDKKVRYTKYLYLKNKEPWLIIGNINYSLSPPKKHSVEWVVVTTWKY